MSDDRLTKLIESQKELQTTYGHNFDLMSLERRCEFIKEMYIATSVELSEIINEIDWKPWCATSKYTDKINDRDFITEVCDAVAFLINMLLAVYPTMTAEDLSSFFSLAFHVKYEQNLIRARRFRDDVSIRQKSSDVLE